MTDAVAATSRSSIVSFNTRDELLRCLRVAASQRHPLPLEAFVVDNASTDGSADAVRAATSRPSRLIENAENLGFARANNHGLRDARGALRR